MTKKIHHIRKSIKTGIDQIKFFFIFEKENEICYYKNECCLILHLTYIIENLDRDLFSIDRSWLKRDMGDIVSTYLTKITAIKDFYDSPFVSYMYSWVEELLYLPPAMKNTQKYYHILKHVRKLFNNLSTQTRLEDKSSW